MNRHGIMVVRGQDGRDRWLLVWKGSIRWGWSAPKWLSPVSWLWKRSGGL